MTGASGSAGAGVDASANAVAGATDRGAAFEAVYTAEHDRLVRTVALITGSAAEAEDIVQEAFAKLFPRIGPIDNAAAWLRTVSVNAARNDIRRRIVRRRYLSRVSQTGAVHTDGPTNELIESLRHLPPRQRAVVVLRFYEDRSEADIAAILGMRLGTVKSSLHRALTSLRQEIDHD
jgi:RNA polymerase sigma-70 factor (sigma-E family)